MNVNGVCGDGVGGGHHVRVYRNDQENALNESVCAWRRWASLSLCSRKSEVGPMGSVPCYGTDSSGDDGLRRDEILGSCASDC